jgi:hypothetical protein
VTACQLAAVEQVFLAVLCHQSLLFVVHYPQEVGTDSWSTIVNTFQSNLGFQCRRKRSRQNKSIKKGSKLRTSQAIGKKEEGNAYNVSFYEHLHGMWTIGKQRTVDIRET